MANVKLKSRYNIINGIRIPPVFLESCAQEAMNYKINSDDVILAAYPKTGSTWMQNLLMYIFRKGRELDDHKMFYMLSPLMESCGYQGIKNMPRPGAMKTHLPLDVIQYSQDAKYIYLLRNPKDTCVSNYYFLKNIFMFDSYDAPFDEYFELFMAGDVPFNSYFDHLKSWERVRNSKNVFFTTYEIMKKDTTEVVLKLASFLGREYIETIEKDNTVLKNILHFSGFEYMKKHMSSVLDYANVTDEELKSPTIPDGIKHRILSMRSLKEDHTGMKFQFLRKGEVGNWKNDFSKEQSERIDQKFMETTKGNEIYDMYKHFM